LKEYFFTEWLQVADFENLQLAIFDDSLFENAIFDLQLSF